MKRTRSKTAVYVVAALCAFEASGIYWGGWGQGHMTRNGVSGGCVLCIDFGSSYFWADAGDAIDLTYDVEVKDGTLDLWISRLTPGKLGDVEGRVEVPSSGSGQWHARISRPGWYHLVRFGDSVRGGHGYDITYKMHWTIDRPRPWYATLASAATFAK